VVRGRGRLPDRLGRGICASRRDDVAVRIVARFADVLAAPEAPSVVAVDIPIGLPERAGPGGRAAENAVRPLLGARQSSVFSVPSRAALAAEDYADACRIAFASSEPPRKVSKQLFMLAPKIREVDALLRDYAAWPGASSRSIPRSRSGGSTASARCTSPRRSRADAMSPDSCCGEACSSPSAFAEEAVNGAPPKGAGADDLLDALACLAIARRIHAGLARPFPDPPARDAFGLPMAIWA
jgi:predicted RNase H-like nuclease